MKVLGRTLGFVIVFGVLAALGFAGYSGLTRFIAVYSRLDFQIAVVTAVLALAACLGAVIVASSIRRAGERSSQSEVLVMRAQAYALFIDVWQEVLYSGAAAGGPVQASRKMRDLSQLLALHGTASVVKAHAAMQSMNPAEARIQFATALMAIRGDLGVESGGLESKELVQLLISGHEEGPSALRHTPQASSQPDMSQDSQARISLAPS